MGSTCYGSASRRLETRALCPRFFGLPGKRGQQGSGDKLPSLRLTWKLTGGSLQEEVDPQVPMLAGGRPC